MSDLIPMTRTGYDKIKAELDHMEKVEMPKIAQRIATASRRRLERKRRVSRCPGIARHAASQDQSAARQAARASIVDTSKVPRDQVVFGATVVVKDLDFGDEETFILVGAGEEDYDAGKILVTSPLAQGLMGGKLGQSVEIPVPEGTMSFEILEIRFDD